MENQTNQQQKTHYKTTENNNNKDKQQTNKQMNTKELVRRKAGVNIWLLKCQTSKQTFS